MNNIRFGKLDATDDEELLLQQKSQTQMDLSRMPRDLYRAYLGRSNLSQRSEAALAIARAAPPCLSWTRQLPVLIRVLRHYREGHGCPDGEPYRLWVLTGCLRFVTLMPLWFWNMVALLSVVLTMKYCKAWKYYQLYTGSTSWVKFYVLKR